MKSLTRNFLLYVQIQLKHTYTYIHAYMHTCIHAYMHTCIHACMHTCMHACMHACMHTRTRTRTRTRTHADTAALTTMRIHIKPNVMLFSISHCFHYPISKALTFRPIDRLRQMIPININSPDHATAQQRV